MLKQNWSWLPRIWWVSLISFLLIWSYLLSPASTEAHWSNACGQLVRVIAHIFNSSRVWALAGPHKDLDTLVLKPCQWWFHWKLLVSGPSHNTGLYGEEAGGAAHTHQGARFLYFLFTVTLVLRLQGSWFHCAVVYKLSYSRRGWKQKSGADVKAEKLFLFHFPPRNKEGRI